LASSVRVGAIEVIEFSAFTEKRRNDNYSNIKFFIGEPNGGVLTK
jgi:hypothetical protein